MTIKITNPQSCNKIPPKREVEETTKIKKFMQMLRAEEEDEEGDDDEDFSLENS
jgi:hypothetical protein